MIKGILSSCLLIIAILFIRRVSQEHIKKSIQYCLWIIVALKLLVFPIPWVTSPIAIFSSNDMKVSNRNAAFSDTVSYDVMALETTESDNISLQTTTIDEKNTFDENVKAKSENIKSNKDVKHNSTTFVIENILKIVFLAIWIIGALILAVKFIVQNYILKKILNENRKKYKQEDVPLNVYVVDDLATPCLYNGNIYTRGDVLKDPIQRKHILAHEYCHYKHGDSFWSVIRGICLVAYWWNPLVWLAVRLSKTDCELACDEAVLDLLGDEERISYGKTLIGLLPSRGNKFFLVASTMEGSKDSMKDRIKFIANKKKAHSSICMAVICMSVVTLACSCTVKPNESVLSKNNDITVQSSKETSETKNDDEKQKNDIASANTEVTEQLNENTTETNKEIDVEETKNEIKTDKTHSENPKQVESGNVEGDEQQIVEVDNENLNYLNHPTEVVEGYSRDITQIIASRNWEELSDNLMYPVYIKGKNYANKEEFLADDLDTVFSEEFINEIQGLDCTNMFTNWQGICIANGVMWLNQDENGNLKVSTIN